MSALEEDEARDIPEEENVSSSLVEYHSKIVGVTFEGRQEVIARITVGTKLRVRREADNAYDPKAVAVEALVESREGGLLWSPIGYIAKDKNADIAAALDAGKEVEITLGGVTGGGDKSFGVNIHLSYEKVEQTTKEVVEEVKPLSPKERLLQAINDFIGSAKSKTIRYESRLLGKSTEVEVVDGHMRLEGYLSGSAFPDKFYQEFKEDDIVQAMLTKHFKEEQFERAKVSILAMWELNKQASTGFGRAIHAALENYDKHHKLGDKVKTVKTFKTKPPQIGPNKALSRNPFLKKIVEDFHEKFGGDYLRLSEQFIWTHEEKLCGSIDRVKVIDADSKVIRIQDFKTDGDIHEKTYQLKESPFYELTKGDKPVMGKELLDLHWLQLSFYAYILTKYYGYTVEGLDVYWVNPDKLCKGENPWEEFSHDVINIEKGL